MIALTMELSKSPEAFPFTGIDPEAYSKMKVDEEPYLDSGHFTPIDEVIKKFQEGMKIVLGKDQDAYALPLHSNDLQGEGVLLKNLRIDQSIDIRLHQLILLKR